MHSHDNEIYEWARGGKRCGEEGTKTTLITSRSHIDLSIKQREKNKINEMK
jgi:hypothetical protein